MGFSKRVVWVVMALIVFLAVAAPAEASTSQFLTFDELPVGTAISDQYEGQGVLFSGESQGEYPEIQEDGSSFTSPVLSGYLSFYSPIHATFVVPGTTDAGTVSGLSLEVGYIDDPGSTRVVIHSLSGTSEIYAEEFGFNQISDSASDITGFEVESTEFEEAGFGIDNVAFTVPDPPPPPPVDECLQHQGSLKHRILANLKCKLRVPILVAKCGISLASWFPVLKVPKTIAGLYILSKTPKALKPIARLYNDLARIKILKNAPKGFRTVGEIRRTFDEAQTGFEVAKDVVKLAKAVSAKDLKQIVEDLEDIAGIKPCLKLLDG